MVFYLKNIKIHFLYLLSLLFFGFAQTTQAQISYLNSIDAIQVYTEQCTPKETLGLIHQTKSEDKHLTEYQKIELDLYKIQALISAELFDDALKIIQLTEAKPNKTPLQVIKVNNSKALIYEFYGKLDDAQDCLNIVENSLNENELFQQKDYATYLIRQSSLYRIKAKEKNNSADCQTKYLEYAQQAYQFSKKNQYIKEEAIACMLLGLNTKYALQKRKSLFEKSLYNFKQIGNKQGAANIYANLAKLQLQKNKTLSALHLLKKGEKEIENTTFYSTKAHIFKEISNLYKSIGQEKESYKYFKKFHFANQQFSFIQKDIKISELNNSFQLANKELKQDALKQKLNQTKSNNTKLIVLLVILLIGVFALAHFALNLRKTQDELFKQKEFVEEKSLEVRRSLHEKEILLKELNHRVRNNLALIISLAQFHINEIDHPVYKEQFQQFEHRLQSICYAHDLYIYELNNETSNRVQLKDYIQKIIDGLLAMHAKKITPFISVKNLSLNIETALPIGIIINELVTNTIKYAKPLNNEPLEFSLLISSKEKEITIDYFDNGQQPSKAQSVKKERNSLGLFIIESMVNQLFGNLAVHNFHYKIKLKQKT